MALERFKKALTKRPMDGDLQQLIHYVDACFGAGSYLVGDPGLYHNTESFEQTEHLKIHRLEAFLRCFGDMTINDDRILFKDFIDLDPLLAFCALEQGTGSPLLGAIAKMAVLYARNDNAVIPVCLPVEGGGR